MFWAKVVEDIKTHILCPITFCRKSCSLWNRVEKYCTAGQATDDDMAHAHWHWIPKYTKMLRIRNI